MFWYWGSVTFTRRILVQAGAAEQVPTPTELPHFCPEHLRPQCSSHTYPNFVHVLHWLTQVGGTPLEVCGDPSMWRQQSAWIPMWAGNVTCKRSVPTLAPLALKYVSCTFLLCTRCGPLVWSKHGQSDLAPPTPKAYFQVNTPTPAGMPAVTGGLQQLVPLMSPHRTELKSEAPSSHPTLHHCPLWVGKRVPHRQPHGLYTLLYIPFWPDLHVPAGPEGQHGKSPFGEPHSRVPGLLLLHPSAEPHARRTGAASAAWAPSWREFAPTCRAQPGGGESGAMLAHFSTLFHVQFKTKLSVISKTQDIWETRFAELLF